MESALNCAMEEWDAELSDWELDDWEPVLRWINEDSTKKEILKNVGDQVLAEFENGKHPLMGEGIARHSCYAAMCNSHEDEPTSETFGKFRLLQAHLLIAHVLATRDNTEIEEYETYTGKEELLKKRSNPYLAGYAVRELSERKLSALLSEISVDSAPDKFVVILRSIVSDFASATKRLTDLILFFEKALGDREQGTRIGGGLGARFGQRIHGGKTDLVFNWELNDRDDPNQNHSQHSTFRRVKLTREKRDELLDLDDYPFDDVEDELGTSEFDDVGYQASPGAYQEASASQLNHVVMANQMFPWSYGTLALAELEEFAKRSYAMQSLASTRALSAPELDELELLALANVMFWTGSSLERVRSLNYFGFPAANKNVGLALLPANDSEMPRWRIAAPLPKYRRPQPEVSDELDRAAVQFLELPDISGASRLVLQLIEQKRLLELDTSKNATTRTYARVFRQKRNWYQNGLKMLINDLDEQSRIPLSRITKTRISNYLFTRILQDTKNDFVAASIITGRDVHLAHVRLFYACPSVRRLQLIYLNAVQEIRGELNEIMGHPLPSAKKSTFSLASANKFIGNRLCPKIATIKAAVIELLERISELSKPYSSEDYRQYHNHYTLYTALMFAYSTGIRGIRTPYLQLGDIFEAPGNTGICVITDKDSGIGYKAKLTWLPPSLMQHMKFYDEFIRCSPDYYEAKKNNWPCFFKREGMKSIEEVRPKTLTETVGDFVQRFLPFPANIHRRFVSSELLDRGCPPEVVEAWMGHWHRGEEWWGPSSSLSFKQYSEALTVYLVPLLEEELKFRSVKMYSPIRVPNE